MAASRSATTATDILRSRNSVPKSSSVAAATSGRIALVASSATSSTPSRAWRALGLGVDHDLEGLVEVGGPVHVDVAVAVAVDHVGHGGVLEHGGDERRAAAWDQAVDRVAQAHELDGGLVAGVGDEGQGVLGQA